MEEYLDKVRPYLKDIINDLKKSGSWKVQLIREINFFSSRDDNGEERVMHSKIDNIEIMISDEADEVTGELFNSLKNRYQNSLQSMRHNEFVFAYDDLLYYKFHRSYIDFTNWIENKKATINPINKKEIKCYQYTRILALNYEEI